MKALTAILGTAFVLFVSAAAMDGSSVQPDAAVQAAQAPAHQHAEGAKCCDKADGMCARDGKADGKTDGKCCKKADCCKDDCCKDGKCKDDCTCECCKAGGCCKKDGGHEGDAKAGCCKKPPVKKPVLVAAH